MYASSMYLRITKYPMTAPVTYFTPPQTLYVRNYKAKRNNARETGSRGSPLPHKPKRGVAMK